MSESRPTPLLDREGRPTLVAIGLPRRAFDDLYHTLLTTSWPRLFALLGSAYVLANALFAGLYALGGPCIVGARPDHPEDLFFFSVHTLSTTGYGTMSPGTLYANVVATVEVMVGVVMVAIFTGLAFAKFSQPRARVSFSARCVVRPLDGVPTLMLRMANGRRNQIVDARLTLSAVLDTTTQEGEYLRRFLPMALVRESTPLFALSWTAMHPVDERSPLHGVPIEELRRRNLELLVTFVGTDDTMHQPVHARHSYRIDDIAWDHRFVDMIERHPDGSRFLHYERFHQVEALAASAQSAADSTPATAGK